MITVVMYSRKGCHLCEQAKADLDALQALAPHTLVELDIDENKDWRQAYDQEVPVVKIGPYLLKAPFTRQDLFVTLSAARDRRDLLEMPEDSRSSENAHRSQVWTTSDRFTDWISKHYLAIFNLFILLYLGLPVLAPVLMKANLPLPASLIYRGYGLVCHQLSYRSFFLFGEQPVYPRAQAGVEGYLTFQQATGMGETNDVPDLWAARQFVGNEQVGYKVALCERDVAIYGGILLFGLLFAVTGRHIRSLPWYLWILIGLVPIGLDGVSQLLSQPPFNFLMYRESTPLLRVVTGALFGLSTAWFGYPMVEESMRDARELMASKRQRLAVALRRAAEKPHIPGHGEQASD